MGSALAWIGSALALLAAGFTALNLALWPRGRRLRAGSSRPRFAILVPARDEEQTISACIEAAFTGTATPSALVVCDDHSGDATAARVLEAQARWPSVRVFSGAALPPGWVGKPHACAQLGAQPEARAADVLLFVDADTQLTAEALDRLVSLLEDYGADVVTAVPRQHMGSWFERWILPLLHLTYTSWLPLPLVWRVRDPRVLAANGQVLAVRRAAYDTIGGFEAVRAEVVDDMAFCRRAKERGLRVVFADGHHIASCRMYSSAGEVWRGFSKNLYEGIGGSVTGLLGVLALYLAAFVLPYLALAAALLAPDAAGALLVPGAVGVGANVAARAALAWRMGHPVSGIVLHPLGVLALLAIAVNSARWTSRGQVRWRGRTYAGRAARERAASPAGGSP